MIKHGVYVNEQATSVSTPVVADMGIPFVIGASCISRASNPAETGIPAICTSWEEFCQKFGYSEDWASYNLCEFAYSHFKLFGCQPVLFCNLVSTATANLVNVAAEDITLTTHKATLPAEAVASTIVVKKSGGSGNAYVEGTDYTVTYTDEACLVSMIATSTHYSDTALNIAFKKTNPALVTAQAVAIGMEAIELCMQTGIIPDLIASPGYSSDAAVAAVMAAKAAGINGLFRAKAVVDLATGTGGAHTYDAANTIKTQGNFVDENMIVCWGSLGLGDHVFHQSTQLCGLMARIDAANGAPYESPSNKNYRMDRLLVEDTSTPGSYNTVNLTKAQADVLNNAGIVTALNFLGAGWVSWGNYTACYPANADVKDYFICISRVFDWVSNTCIRTFWGKIDLPMNRRLIDNIIDTCNIWLDGLSASGKIIGGRCEMIEAENPLTDLMAGIMRVHIYITPPSPAQEIDFTLEYDVSYVEALFAG